MALSETRQLDLVLNLKDKASKNLSSFSTELGLLQSAAKAAAVGIAAVGAGLVAVGVSAIKSASDYEQNRIAFEGMLGSAEKAKTLLKDITALGASTPFELPQLVTASKQLLAYGLAQEDVIPKLKMLGDISATVGMDKMPELILAFGQVKAKGKLAGQEMLQFTNTGIGLRDALVKLANEGKGAFAAFKNVGSASGKSAGEVKELNDKLKIANQRLSEAKKRGNANKSTLMSLSNTVENYKEKITSATTKTNTFSKQGQIAWADLEKAMSKGEITYEMVSEALQSMTVEGGIAHDAMIRQSKTFAGVISNLQDYLGIFLRNLVGMSTEGDVKEGSIFYYLKEGAVALYGFLEKNKEVITRTFTEAVQKGVDNVKEWYESIGGANGLKQKLLEVWDVIKTVSSAIIGFTGFIWEHRNAILAIVVAYESLKVAMAITGAIRALTVAFTLLSTMSIAPMIALLTSPVGLVAALAVALVGAIYLVAKEWGKLKDTQDDVRESMRTVGESLDEMQTKVGSLSTEKANKQLQDSIDKARELREEANKLAEMGFWKSLGTGFVETMRKVGKTIGVNDAVITPQGDVIKTDPADYLIATKTPGALAGASGGSISVNIMGGMYLDRNAGEKLAEVLSETLRRKLRL